MTISALGATAVYFGLGSTGPFSLTDDNGNPILFEANSEIIVTVTDLTGEYDTGAVTLTLTLDYLLTGAGLPTPGAVTLTAPLPLGAMIIIRRRTPITQNLDLIFGGDLSLEDLEAVLDKLTRLIQEQNEKTDRALMFSATETALIDTFSQIVPAPLAESALVWNAGNQLENRLVSTLGGAVGPPGPPGTRGRPSVGLRGEAGEDGEPGPPGRRGPTGLRGRAGAPTPPGVDGEDGPPGMTGRRGAVGLTGATGARGQRGFFGAPGADGDDGVPGVTGRRGIPGAQGIQGPAGFRRTTVIQGEQGEDGEIGRPGQRAPSVIGRHTIWIPAPALIARTTAGAAAGTAEGGTNRNMFKTLDFDTATQEFAQVEVHFPKSWNLGTVSFQPVWSHAATTVNFGVAWGLAGVARSDDDAGDVAFGTAVTSVDTGGTTNDIYIGPESAAITIAGTPALGDTVQFQINRTVADAGDTMAIDARLHGFRLFFNISASTDA